MLLKIVLSLAHCNAGYTMLKLGLGLFVLADIGQFCQVNCQLCNNYLRTYKLCVCTCMYV